MKCFLLGWRRIERMPVICTSRTRLPMTSFSRSRRSVSTSGSSGIGAPAGEELPSGVGRGLLGLLLRAPVSGTADLAVDVDGRREDLGVVGTGAGDDITRQLVEPPGNNLLQAGLEVVAP